MKIVDYDNVIENNMYNSGSKKICSGQFDIMITITDLLPAAAHSFGSGHAKYVNTSLAFS